MKTVTLIRYRKRGQIHIVRDRTLWEKICGTYPALCKTDDISPILLSNNQDPDNATCVNCLKYAGIIKRGRKPKVQEEPAPVKGSSAEVLNNALAEAFNEIASSKG